MACHHDASADILRHMDFKRIPKLWGSQGRRTREEKEDQNAKEETTGTWKGKKKSKQNQAWKKRFKVNSSIRVTVGYE